MLFVSCALLFIWAFVVSLGRLTFATSLSGLYLLDVALVGDFGVGRSFMSLSEGTEMIQLLPLNLFL